MRKRGVTVLSACVLMVVGALLSIGVSWVGAVIQSRGQLNRLLNRDHSAILIERDPAWPAPPPIGWPSRPLGALRFSGPLWTELSAQTSDPVDTKWMGWAKWRGWSSEESRSGWPLRCLHSWKWTDAHSSVMSVTTYGPQISDPRVQSWLGGESLPIVPLWPGFALNTLFYAAIAWGLWQLPLAIRRRRRRSKGLCVRCGYDLKGLAAGNACPECGGIPVAPR